MPAIPEPRAALARMYIDLTKAFYATLYPPDQPPGELDANLAVVAVAVMLGHCERRPMTASQLAHCLHMPRTSVLRRLETLIAHNLIERVGDQYFLEATRAAKVPHRDTFDLILSKGFAVLGPYLSKMDT